MKKKKKRNHTPVGEKTTGFGAELVKNSCRNTAGSMRRLKPAFSNIIETTADSQRGQDGEIFPAPPSQTGVVNFQISFFAG